ncbi:MAG: hypothetical protein LBT30_00555, partial [Clostridiales bacterium]|nr:hypothetical protein [Clostridiales bacterium]
MAAVRGPDTYGSTDGGTVEYGSTRGDPINVQAPRGQTFKLTHYPAVGVLFDFFDARWYDYSTGSMNSSWWTQEAYTTKDANGNGILTYTNLQTDYYIIVYTAPAPSVTINASAGSGGSISPSGSVDVPSGTNKSFTANPSSGYEFDYFRIDNSSNYSSSSTYTFNTVTTGHTIVAYFKLSQYTISASAGTGGSISPSGNQTVNSGGSQSFTAYPSTGYLFDYFRIDNSSNYTASSTYNFSGVTGDHSIVAYFKIQTFQITANYGSGGTISPGTTAVNYNSNQSFTANPSTGYVFDYFAVDSGTDNSSSTYTFYNVTATHSITAYFKVATFTITPYTTTGGTISPTTAATVNYNASSPAYTATPGTGYNFAYFLIDGAGTQYTANPYTINNVTGSHTITAYFSIKTYTITPSTTTGGTISPSTAGSVNHGSSSSAYTASANPGYVFDYFTIDGTTTKYTENPYTFSNVITGHTIEAHFKFATYTIDTTAGAGGWIDPDTTITYSSGSNVRINFGANTRFNILEVNVNGIANAAAKANGYYIVPNTVTSNQTVSVTFIATYTITATIIGNGAVSPSGTTIVEEGSGQTYTFTPGGGQRVLSIVVDGAALSVTQLAAAISVGYQFTNVRSDRTIEVTFLPAGDTPYTITAITVGNGTILPGTMDVPSGSSRRYTFVPGSGQKVLSIVVDGDALDATALSNAISNGYLFSNITSDHEIEVTFVANGATTYKITATAVGYGKIKPGTMNVPSNSNRLYTFVPDNSYKVLSVVVDGAALSVTELEAAINNGYQFSNITANHTIEVTFVPIVATTYTITAIVKGNGKVLPGTMDVLAGTDRLYTFVPNSGNKVLSIVVDGRAFTASELATAKSNGYWFLNITSDHEIEVTFLPNSATPYTITATTIGNGTILPGTMDVPSGSNRLYTFIPDSSHRVLSIIVDGNSLSGGDLTDAINNGYLFSNVTDNHTIIVEFVFDSATTYKIVSTATVGGKITPLGTIYVVA